MLYLDADTELTAPVPFLFDALDAGWEVVCTKDVEGYDLIYSLWRRDSDEMRLGRQALGSDRALQLAGGVMAWRRTVTVEAFLTAWYAEWHRLARRDQGAMLRALYQHPVRLLTLGNEWNRFEGICKEEPAGIIHHRGGPARRVPRWGPGRLDDPAAWNGRRANARPIESVIPPRLPHAGAVVTMAYLGPKDSRRIAGRSGRQYLFDRNASAVLPAEDGIYIALQHPQLWRVTAMNCPVCGAENAVCKGQSLFDGAKVSELMQHPTRLRLPRQRSHRGITGYIGDVEVYDPAVPPQRHGAGNGADPDAKEAAAPADKARKRKARTKQRREVEVA